MPLLRTALLSISSSLDNFAVGLTFGIRRRPLSTSINLLISTCNALGALLSAYVGSRLGETVPALAGAAAGLLFLGLAALEFAGGAKDGKDDESGGVLSGLLSRQSSLSPSLSDAFITLCIPMTLNNLAAGTVGGLSGSGPLEMCAAAAVASYVLMAIGSAFGRSSVAVQATQSVPASTIAAAIFACLGFLQLLGAAGLI